MRNEEHTLHRNARLRELHERLTAHPGANRTLSGLVYYHEPGWTVIFHESETDALAIRHAEVELHYRFDTPNHIEKYEL